MTHLDSLEIRQFRGFKVLEVPKLGRVNLVVGRNNAGKSSFLEAVRLYATEGAPAVLYGVLNQRSEHEVRLMAPSTDDTFKTGVPYWYIVHGRDRRKYLPAPIVIGPLGKSKRQLKMSLRWFSYDAAASDPGPAWREIDESDLAELDSLSPAFKVDVGDVTKHRIWLDRPVSDLQRRYRAFDDEMATCTYVPSGGFEESTVAHWWSGITLTSLEDAVLEALRLIEPTLSRITLVEGTRARTFIAKVGDVDAPIPLGSMGEGIRRILSIVLALANARNGFLLVDEIENGIHFTVQARLWKTILHLAHELNVQVFATSHSLDCIRAFNEAVNEGDLKDCMLIRLSRRSEDIVAVTYDGRQLNTAIEHEVEVR